MKGLFYMEFKIGDRVKAILPCDGDRDFVGKCGEVISTRDHNDTRLPFKVRFDFTCEFGSNEWWCEEKSLKLEAPIDYSTLTEIEE